MSYIQTRVGGIPRKFSCLWISKSRWRHSALKNEKTEQFTKVKLFTYLTVDAPLSFEFSEFKKIFIKSEKYIENNIETGQAYSQNCWKQWIEVVNESYTNLRSPLFFFCQLLLYTLSLKQSQLRDYYFFGMFTWAFKSIFSLNGTSMSRCQTSQHLWAVVFVLTMNRSGGREE